MGSPLKRRKADDSYRVMSTGGRLMKTLAQPSFFRAFDLLLSTTNPGLKQAHWIHDGVEFERERHSFSGAKHGQLQAVVAKPVLQACEPSDDTGIVADAGLQRADGKCQCLAERIGSEARALVVGDRSGTFHDSARQSSRPVRAFAEPSTGKQRLATSARSMAAS